MRLVCRSSKHAKAPAQKGRSTDQLNYLLGPMLQVDDQPARTAPTKTLQMDKPLSEPEKMKTIIRYTLFLLVLLSVSPSYSSDNIPTKHTDAKNETPTNYAYSPEKASENINLLVKKTESVISRPFNADKAENQDTKSPDNPNESWWFRFRTDPIVTFTFLLFIATVFLWWSTRQLVRSAENTSKIQLRAYVNPGPGGRLNYNPMTTDVFGVTIDLHNTGQTPAYKTCYVGRVEVLPYPRCEKSVFDEFTMDITEGRKKGSFTIPSQGHAGANIGNNTTMKFTIEQLNEILMSPTRRIFAFGIIEYFDIFNIRRTTNFCYSFGAENPLSATPLGSFIPGVFTTEYTLQDNDAN
jgi:hypothetical protein